MTYEHFGHELREAVVDARVKPILEEAAWWLGGDEISMREEAEKASDGDWCIDGYARLADYAVYGSNTPSCLKRLADDEWEEFLRLYAEEALGEDHDPHPADMTHEERQQLWDCDREGGPEYQVEPDQLQLPGFEMPPYWQTKRHQRAERFLDQWMEASEYDVNFEMRAEYLDESVRFTAQIYCGGRIMDSWALEAELPWLTEEGCAWIEHGLKNFFNNA